MGFLLVQVAVAFRDTMLHAIASRITQNPEALFLFF